jgi:hypothetical protein
MLHVAADYCCLMNSPEVSEYSQVRQQHCHLLIQPAIKSRFLMAGGLNPEDGGSTFLQKFVKFYHTTGLWCNSSEVSCWQEPHINSMHHQTLTKPARDCNTWNTRRIHKISSICKYCHCNPAVTMVRMHAEFVGPLGRYGCNLQTIEPRLRIALCV